MTTPLEGSKPTSDERKRLIALADYWQKIANETPSASLAKIEDAAKQVVTITSVLQGIYFAVVAMVGVRERIDSWLVLLYALPPVLWFGSLLAAIQVFTPFPRAGADLNDFTPDAWMQIRDTFIVTVGAKWRWLQYAHMLLLGSFVVTLALVGSVTLLPQAPQQPATEMILISATPLPTMTDTPLPPTSSPSPSPEPTPTPVAATIPVP